MFLALASLLAPKIDVPLPVGPGPVTNPLKGYAPYMEAAPATDVPTTMAFYETSWRELEPSEGDYRFAEWEAKTMRSPAAKGKRVVLRVWMDYPNQPVGVPPYLIDTGVKMNPYDDKEVGKGLSPD